ncbi:LOW QUALITY PROTEIN: putative F-box/LRR-repeat protein At3g18150 [Rhodamnia argentea]|uniref:LOW QUALITY PROTEIN: putative F-box/LRR-repeat protein At3g18150 n=1 Tax=Rhodamnia argentea TaxID=178133 RepID=A0A8B8QAR9_9MYRT|nr:LOW QUALITY PROTEIN: putative F-box/LRR-repeat protein At3g18150 [Rhodamnia argentea]
MGSANWRPLPLPGGGGGGGTGAALYASDWRAQLPPESRGRIVNKIMDTLKRHLPVSGPEGLQELNKIAVRFEEKIYTAATSQSDYLRRISLKMLTMAPTPQNNIPNALPSNSAGNSSENSGKGKILKTPPYMAGSELSLDRPCQRKRARISPSNQDETRNPVDYISQLPDAIIFHIFSFLSTKDAIKTSVLSKQWRSTWTSNQHMSFSLPPGSSRKFKSFIAFVDSALSHCTAIKVKRFHFDAPCLALMQSSLDRWLQFAIGHGVEELSVTLHDWRHHTYVLPRILFICTTLVSLRVSQCCFLGFNTVNWCSLKTLRIENAELNDDGMVTVLSGSPVLEFLELKSCRGVKHIMVESKSFRELVIDSHEFRRDQGSMLKISAPHLLKLRLLGNSQGGEFILDEVSSLIEAELNFDMESSVFGKVKAHGDLVKGLLKRLHHVTKLVMGSWCLQVLSFMEAREVLLPSLECRHLILLGSADREGVPVIAKILESSPHLEKLFLQVSCTSSSVTEFNGGSVSRRDFDGEEFWNSAKWRMYQCLMHLKHVEIVDRGANSLAWEPILSLLKFLLQNALWLDKIVINSTNSESSQAVDPWVLLEVARILLSHPKCSPSTRSFLGILPKDVCLNVHKS